HFLHEAQIAARFARSGQARILVPSFFIPAPLPLLLRRIFRSALASLQFSSRLCCTVFPAAISGVQTDGQFAGSQWIAGTRFPRRRQRHMTVRLAGLLKKCAELRL